MRTRSIFRPVRLSSLAAFLILPLMGSALPVSAASQAQADPGVAACSISIGGKSINYLCQYGVTESNYDSRKHVFVVGTNEAVWHIWDTTPGPYGNGPFSNWTSLGGIARSNVVATKITVGGSLALQAAVAGTTLDSAGRRHIYCKQYNLPSNPGRWTPGQLSWTRGTASTCP